ncbi:hypothetical protein AWM68_20285 [Fictibacillus phosphorivorans]|uniref:Uncharacterized protein n=1 Tax=Fictibacillus phosphorivorans TaxID=1221500 RepID=A0A163RFX6_9BACL|nr:hypothetical protein [Fictibacillus phosphorivorans]KZE66780.1 hypothetical protein AWM68_20285 [Fictibacillus phosphorivorans]
MGKVFISKKQRKLLLSSSVINQNDFLEIKLLLEKYEILTFDALSNEEKGQTYQAVLPNLLGVAQSEWEEDGTTPVIDLGENYKSIGQACSLCGKKPLRWKCPIKNQYTKQTLVVGSECSKEFGEEMKIRFKHYMKEAAKAAKIKELNDKFPGISKVVEMWSSKLGEYPIIISEELDSRWRILGDKLTKIFNNFIDGKMKKSPILTIESLLLKRECLLKEIEIFIEMNRKKSFIAQSDLAKWLRTNGKQDVIETIKKDGGFIKWRTAHRITEANFMRDLAIKFNTVLKNIGLKIEGTGSTKAEYIFKFTDAPLSSLEFSYQYSEFVLNYGGLIFEENLDIPINIREVFDKGTLRGLHTHEKIVLELVKRIKDSSLVYKSLPYNELIFNFNNEYFLVEYKSFAERYKRIIFGDDIKSEEIINHINLSSRKMNKQSYNLHLEARQIARKEVR